MRRVRGRLAPAIPHRSLQYGAARDGAAPRRRGHAAAARGVGSRRAAVRHRGRGRARPARVVECRRLVPRARPVGGVPVDARVGHARARPGPRARADRRARPRAAARGARGAAAMHARLPTDAVHGVPRNHAQGARCLNLV